MFLGSLRGGVQWDIPSFAIGCATLCDRLHSYGRPKSITTYHYIYIKGLYNTLLHIIMSKRIQVRIFVVSMDDNKQQTNSNIEE